MYDDTSFPGWIKIGQTTRADVRERIDEQHPITEPHKTYHLLWYGSAFYADGSGDSFSDHDLHDWLRRSGKKLTGEWCRCSLREAKAAYVAVRNRDTRVALKRDLDYAMRPEQEDAVERTAAYFAKMDKAEPDRPSHYLWNAKMRFGKTFATYQLAKRMGAQRVLVLTFKPAVEDSWNDDLMRHRDFDGWQFFSSRSDIRPQMLNGKGHVVVFGSFQDYLGKNALGGIKAKNEWVHAVDWDLIVLDEYHFGAWNERAKTLLDIGDPEAKRRHIEEDQLMRENDIDTDGGSAWDEGNVPITGRHFLYLSGTPFRALATGEFMEEQIFNWTYQDEQEQKQRLSSQKNNPYAEMPTMVMMTYQMPQDLGALIEQWDMDSFDLNEFFRAEGDTFVHEKAVQKWLDIIRGKASIFGDSSSPLNKPPVLPFEDVRLQNLCNHTMWFLPNVAACDAMEALLHQPTNGFYQKYTIINCSGTKAGIGVEALEPVREAMGDNPLQTRTITLTCGKLTTGVTLRPLGGLLMLRNCSSPETYFQTAFRVQSPWTRIDKDDPTKKIILKPTCYVFDFAPNRALREVVTYANKLNVEVDGKAPKSQVNNVDEFINFLPILQFDGSTMKQVNATDILDFVDNGTSGTMLARRWNSSLLVDVSNATLQRVLNNPEAYATIKKIEGFRAMGSDIIESIVNKAEKIKRMKGKAGDKPDPKTKKALSEEQKEYLSKRREVLEKLKKFATRIPIFMYMTDYREESLTDVITVLEPTLFERVTGLTQKDFDLLRRVGVFNQANMNNAILQFRRYEDASLEYTGVSRHADDKKIGLYDSSITIEAVVDRKRI